MFAMAGIVNRCGALSAGAVIESSGVPSPNVTPLSVDRCRLRGYQFEITVVKVVEIWDLFEVLDPRKIYLSYVLATCRRCNAAR